MSKYKDIRKDLYGSEIGFLNPYLDIYQIELEHLQLTMRILNVSLPVQARSFFFTWINLNNIEASPPFRIGQFLDFSVPLLPTRNSIPIYIDFDEKGKGEPRISKVMGYERYYQITISPETSVKELAITWLELLVRDEAIPSEGTIEYFPRFLEECGVSIIELPQSVIDYFK